MTGRGDDEDSTPTQIHGMREFLRDRARAIPAAGDTMVSCPACVGGRLREVVETSTTYSVQERDCTVRGGPPGLITKLQYDARQRRQPK